MIERTFNVLIILTFFRMETEIIVQKLLIMKEYLNQF